MLRLRYSAGDIPRHELTLNAGGGITLRAGEWREISSEVLDQLRLELADHRVRTIRTGAGEEVKSLVSAKTCRAHESDEPLLDLLQIETDETELAPESPPPEAPLEDDLLAPESPAPEDDLLEKMKE